MRCGWNLRKIFSNTQLIEFQKNVLLDLFYKSLCLDKKRIVHQIFLGGLSRLPIAMESHLLDNLSIPNKETEKNHIFATLLTNMDLVIKKIMELGAPKKL